MKMITDFEEISSVDINVLKEKAGSISKEIIARAWIGTSPTNAAYLSSVFTDIDFEKERDTIGRIKIEEVEAAQQEVLRILNKE